VSDIYKEFKVDFLRTRYAGPTAAEIKMAQEITRLRAEIARLRARIDANAIEYDRLLSRCAALEHVRQQAHALLDFEDAGTYDPAGKGWEHLEENLRNALKEAPT